MGDGQGSPACCGSWGRKESDMTERLIGSDLNMFKDSKVVHNTLRARIKKGFRTSLNVNTIMTFIFLLITG